MTARTAIDRIVWCIACPCVRLTSYFGFQFREPLPRQAEILVSARHELQELNGAFVLADRLVGAVSRLSRFFADVSALSP